MKNLNIKSTNKIMFIENKANYIDYIQNKKNAKELVIFHGGMYSPMKGEFFKKIYEVSNNVEFYHWSDIDIGGFKIFTRLKENIISELKPFKMDKNTLIENKKYWRSFNENYKDLLLELYDDSRYNIFFDVIDVMLRNNICLEQESLI